MNLLRDPVLLFLSGLLVLTLSAFFAGLLPYPFGLLILTVFIMARIFQNHRTPK